MNLVLLANIIACAGALGGFIYGGIRFFRPKSAVYALMITLAAGVTVFGRLYQIIRLVTVGDIMERFHLGFLGTVGSLLFLFAANFGLMDTLCDDKSKELRKYRLIPLAAPALVLVLYFALFFFSDLTTLVKVAAGAAALVLMLASYYNLKHLIIPDVDFGVVRSLRQCNLLALIHEFLCVAEIFTLTRNYTIGTLVIGILSSILMPLIIIAVDWGVKKWTT